MKTRIVKIGNSQGIRIPKPLIEQTGLSGEVEIGVEDNRLVITGAHRPRAGWPEAFKTMAEAGDDALLDGQQHLPTRWECGLQAVVRLPRRARRPGAGRTPQTAPWPERRRSRRGDGQPRLRATTMNSSG